MWVGDGTGLLGVDASAEPVGVDAHNVKIELVPTEAADGAVIETVIDAFPIGLALAVRPVLFFFELFAVRCGLWLRNERHSDNKI